MKRTRVFVLTALVLISLMKFTTVGSEDRPAQARKNCQPQIDAEFEKAGLHYPAAEVLLRALKHEGKIEVYANNQAGDPLRLVTTYEVLGRSGRPGPKRREGDGQVPEGWYKVDRFNPKSSFHLSLGLDYPNAADLVHAHKTEPGSDIFIHGGSATVGCLPIGDAYIEALYLIAQDAKDDVRVLILPAGFEEENVEFFAKYPQHAEFWADLKNIDVAFATTKKTPQVNVTEAGRYTVGK